MSMIRILVCLIGFMSVQSAFAIDSYKVRVVVQRIVIDNSNPYSPGYDFSVVCEVNAVVKFQDVRNTRTNNGLPDTLAHNCEFDFLGAKQKPELWAGGGVYLEKTQNGSVDKYSIQGVIRMGEEVATVWSASRKEISDIELVVDTPQRSIVSAPDRKESLRVTYQFYN